MRYDLEENVKEVLQQEGRPLCKQCITERTGRSRSGVYAACQRLLAAGSLTAEEGRTCRRCRRIQTSLLRRCVKGL
jgi:predicted transcriptional regulator